MRSVFKLSTSTRLGGESEKDKKRSPDEPEYHCANVSHDTFTASALFSRNLKKFLKFRFLKFLLNFSSN